MSIQSINSATGEVLENFSETTSAEIARILESGYLAFEQWRHRPFPERAKRMLQAAQILRNGKEKYARTMALEMGKPLVQVSLKCPMCRAVRCRLKRYSAKPDFRRTFFARSSWARRHYRR